MVIIFSMTMNRCLVYAGATTSMVLMHTIATFLGITNSHRRCLPPHIQPNGHQVDSSGHFHGLRGLLDRQGLQEEEEERCPG